MVRPPVHHLLGQFWLGNDSTRYGLVWPANDGYNDLCCRVDKTQLASEAVHTCTRSLAAMGFSDVRAGCSTDLSANGGADFDQRNTPTGAIPVSSHFAVSIILGSRLGGLAPKLLAQPRHVNRHRRTSGLRFDHDGILSDTFLLWLMDRFPQEVRRDGPVR